ncbi:MAG: hypothetical protein ACRDBG_15530 [Waterburya sp.]
MTNNYLPDLLQERESIKKEMKDRRKRAKTNLRVMAFIVLVLPILSFFSMVNSQIFIGILSRDSIDALYFILTVFVVFFATLICSVVELTKTASGLPLEFLECQLTQIEEQISLLELLGEEERNQ